MTLSALVGSATVIPVSGIYPGPVGSIGQADLPHIKSRQVNPADTDNIAFGETLTLNSNNTYSSIKQFIANSGTLTSSVPLGFAVANVSTNGFYPLGGGSGAGNGGYFVPGGQCDALRQGTIWVVCNVGTPTAGGTVYVRVSANGGNTIIGGIEATSDSSHTVALTNVVFTDGVIGSDGTTQVTILNQQIP